MATAPSSLAMTYGYGMANNGISVMNNDYKDWKSHPNIKEMVWDDPNIINYYAQERSNYLNLLQWQDTNAWNQYMWDLENEYNSPSAQKQRYIEAGINPLWAMSETKAMPSASASSPLPSPNVPSQFSYEGQALENDMIKFAQTNALNGSLGYSDLFLKRAALELSAKQSKSEIDKINAETEKIKSETVSLDFMNRINISTYQIQVDQLTSSLEETRQRISNLKSQEKLNESEQALLAAQESKERALVNQIDAATKKIERETEQLVDYLQLAYLQYSVNKQNADSQTSMAASAAVSAEATTKIAQISQDRLTFDINTKTQEFKLQSNEQLLTILEKSRSAIDSFFGSGSAIGHYFGHSDDRFFKLLQDLKAVGFVLTERQFHNPSQSNTNALGKYLDTIRSLTEKLRMLPSLPVTSSSATSALNPSPSWQQ